MKIKRLFSLFLSLTLIGSLFAFATKNSVKADSSTVGVSYSAYVQNMRWQDTVSDGELAGTKSQSLRLQAFKASLTNIATDSNASITYQAYMQSYGWQPVAADGDTAGITTKAKRMEAIRISISDLDGYSVEYRVYQQFYEWSDWKITENDTEIESAATAGVTGKSKRIEAIEIKLVKTGDSSTTSSSGVNSSESSSTTSSSSSAAPSSASSQYRIVYGDMTDMGTPTKDNFAEYLRYKYIKVLTPIGTLYPDFETNRIYYSGDNDDLKWNYDFRTKWHQLPDGSSLDVSQLVNDTCGYTSSEISQTKAELQELQKEIYNDTKTYFPHDKITGGYSYNYYNKNKLDPKELTATFLSWHNYDDNDYITGFNWTISKDTYDFSK